MGQFTMNASSDSDASTTDPDSRSRSEISPETDSDGSSSVDHVADKLARALLDDKTVSAHLDLLRADVADEDAQELASAPVFTAPVLEYGALLETEEPPFSQYGLLGAVADDRFKNVDEALASGQDPRIFFNTVPPSSVFICGSQGSGKSHTLSCFLENCLTPSDAAVLPRPLTGLVCHYDPWCSDTGGSPCEAAYLSSAKDISVRILCPPTNIGQIRRIYSSLPRVTVEELRINQSDLNTRRMLDLMAISSGQGNVPLYVHVVTRILRELRVEQQTSKATFNYRSFKHRLEDEETLTAAQLGPLKQRLDALESFMVKEQVVLQTHSRPLKGIGAPGRGNVWTPIAGQLTIVDLSCPCVTVETACSLFNICLSLFLEQDSQVGRVVALDEAHKYMTDTAECQTLTEALLSNIRMQRHLAMRVIISTQEPTISPRLLDLCSVTIVHRFTSPDWLDSLKRHLAGASVFAQAESLARDNDDDDDDDSTSGGNKKDGILKVTSQQLATQLFSRIVALRRGEALMFAPSAIVGVRNVKTEESKDGEKKKKKKNSRSSGRAQLIKLGHGVLNIRVRQRVTWDGGRSVMAA